MNTWLLRLAFILCLFPAFPSSATTHYVDPGSSGPVAPYSSWATAATNIQDAVDASSSGDLVLVTNGTYATGGRAPAPGFLTNRLTVTVPITIQSVNGPAVTIIQGYQLPGPTNGNAAIRCVYLTNGASLSGFTLTGGATHLFTGAVSNDVLGGGIWCASTNVIISNCIVVSNLADYGGGGIYGGSIFNSSISNNNFEEIPSIPSQGDGGGAFQSYLQNCTLFRNRACYGGGVSQSTLQNCNLLGNEGNAGGGAFASTLNNCSLIGNLGNYSGGGAQLGALINCLVLSNSAIQSVAFSMILGNGAGAASNSLYNCTVIGNHGLNGTFDCTNYNSIVYSNMNTDDQGSTFTYCCTSASESGLGNITHAPLFVGSTNFQLQSNSPCINAGNNLYVMGSADLNGNPRISGATVDIGAYEFQNPASLISYAWLEQYGLATDGSADYADTDGNGMKNWQKWVAGLNPTNPASILQMMPPASSGTNLVVTWQSVPNINYFLQRSSSLAPGSFQPLATNIPGQTGTTSYTDTNAPAPGPWYYRVGVP